LYFNFLNFFTFLPGNWGRPGRPVSNVECGRNTMVAIVAPSPSQRDIEEAYLRAVKADTHNAIILRQYESFTQLYDLHGNGEKIEGPCILCTTQKQCEICYLKEEFKYILDEELKKIHPSEIEFMTSLREMSHLLMIEPMPSIVFIPELVKPIRHCTSTFEDFSSWRKRNKEGGRIPTIWEALEKAGNYTDAAYDLFNYETEHRVIDEEERQKAELAKAAGEAPG